MEPTTNTITIDPSTMDALIAQSNFSAVFTNQLDLLKAELHETLHYHQHGGVFYLNDAFVAIAASALVGITEDDAIPMVFLDTREIPVLVPDVRVFVQGVLDRRRQALVKYFTNYQKLKDSRTIEALLDA